MEQEAKTGSLKRALKTVSDWLLADKPDVVCLLPLEADQSLEEASREGSAETVPDNTCISPSVMTISEKLVILKNMLDFGKSLETRLNEVHTHRELLVYLHDVLLSRFEKLCDIGLINRESSRIIRQIDEKTATMLVSTDIPGSEENGRTPHELRKINEELRLEISTLHDRYLKTGIITDRELTLEKEIKYLQSKIREQQSKIKLAGKKLKYLLPYQEMAKSLQARNSILKSRVDHQARLLKSLAEENPKHKQLLSNIERLRADNTRLKAETDKRTGLLGQLKMLLPHGSRHIVDELMDNNGKLHTDLMEKQAELEDALSATGSEESLLEAAERLSEENAQLSERLDTHRNIDSYMKDHKGGTIDVDGIVRMLKAENRQMGLALQSKDRQIQTLRSETSERPAIKAYWELQNKYRQLSRESRAREELYAQAQVERENLAAQARERTALARENERLKAELEGVRQSNDAFTKLELQCASLKRERGELRVKYEALTVQNTELTQKLSKVTAEYRFLMKEYENIFGAR